MPPRLNLRDASRDDLDAEMRATADEIKRIAALPDISDRDEARLDDLAARYDDLEARDKDLQRQELLDRVRAGTSEAMDGAAADPDGFLDGSRRSRGHQDRNEPAGLAHLRGEALRSVDAHSGRVHDAGLERITRALEGDDVDSWLPMARWARVASDDAYASAFGKLLRHGPTSAPLMLDDRERAALAAAEQYRSIQIGGTGGYLVPFHLDPAVNITNDGSVSAVRQLARHEVIASDVWHGVNAEQVDASWDAESVQVSDDTPTFDQPSIAVHKLAAFVPISIEALSDSQNVTVEIGALMADAADNLTAAALATGTGTGQPFGIVTALVASSPTVVVAATTNNQFGAADVYKLQAALGPRYQPRASWIANLGIVNTIAQFETGNGAKWFPEVGSNPPALLRRRLAEDSNMDGVIATGDDYVLVYGDFSQYVIVDRVGTTIELVPHLFGADRRPTGERGFYMWSRVGGDSINDNAFRLLRV